tara:strand:- start:26 stop:481 length:456 start_codon:yes stop_codon:yes gene_type:complete
VSTVVLDTITGKTTATTITIGSTPVVSASANSMTIRGEGSNQTSIQQGLAKVWSRYTSSGTAALTDSFNVTSFSDGGTGIGQITYSSNMNNADYNCTASCGELSGGGNRVIGMNGSTQAPSTSSVAFKGFNTSFSATDLDFNCITVHGDLA